MNGGVDHHDIGAGDPIMAHGYNEIKMPRRSFWVLDIDGNRLPARSAFDGEGRRYAASTASNNDIGPRWFEPIKGRIQSLQGKGAEAGRQKRPWLSKVDIFFDQFTVNRLGQTKDLAPKPCFGQKKCPNHWPLHV